MKISKILIMGYCNNYLIIESLIIEYQRMSEY